MALDKHLRKYDSLVTENSQKKISKFVQQFAFESWEDEKLFEIEYWDWEL